MLTACLQALLKILPNIYSQTVDQELSNIIGELWKLDVNRLKPGTDYKISLQVWYYVIWVIIYNYI